MVLYAAVFWLHVAVILFNLFGLIAVPLGAWRNWGFVRDFWWRLLHLLALGIVALQAIFGRACFLTLWQSDLIQSAGGPVSREPMIQRWVSELIYWPLPIWAFAVLYVAVWVYALLLWRLVPPRRRRA